MSKAEKPELRLEEKDFYALFDKYKELGGLKDGEGEQPAGPANLLRLAKIALELKGVSTEGKSSLELMKGGGPLVRDFFATLKASTIAIEGLGISIPPLGESSSP